MTTGRRTLRQNTRERIISTDWNRTETFIGADANEELRGQLLRPVDDTFYVGTTFDAPGPFSLAIDVSTVAAPSYGGVIDGLMVVVPAGATHLLVTAGTLLVIDPESPANPDDPISKYVRDAGVQIVTPQLTWTPNPGPGTRIDVVECQRSEIVQEVDNRDVFDPSTGLFNPTAVTKVTKGALTYRIRLGAPGGGLPAPALGWFPLAVLSTPAGAVDLDTVGVWDVRNLFTDHAPANTSVSNADVRALPGNKWLLDGTPLVQYRFSGRSVKTLGGYQFGGTFYDPLFGTPYIDLGNAPAYHAAGFVPAPSLPLYVYALYMPGYVRWVPYYFAATPGAGGRTPGPFRGILAVSQTPPLLGQPTVPIAPPTATGLGGSTPFGVAIASSAVDAAGAFLQANYDSEWVNFSPLDLATGAIPWRTIAGTIIANEAYFPLTPGTDFPFGVNKVRATLTTTFSPLGAANGDSNVVTFQTRLWNPIATVHWNRAVQQWTKTIVRNPVFGAFALDQTFVEFPVLNDGLSQPNGGIVQLRLSTSNLGGSVAAAPLTAASLRISGWDWT